MKTLYPLRRQQAGRFSGITDAILGLLLIVGLFQIALCSRSAIGLLPPVDSAASATQGPAYVTTAPVARDVAVPSNEKS
jgi:hypothetical protein